MAITGSLALIDTAAPRQRAFASATALQVQVLTHERDLADLREAWDELLANTASSSFFLCWAWNQLWWQTYAPPNSQLYLLVCRDAEGNLLGLAPLYWQQRSFAGVPHIRDLNFIGTGAAIKTSEHLDVLARRGFERAVGEALAAFLNERRDWDRLWLWNVPAHSAVLPHLQKALGQRAIVQECDHPHSIDTTADWESIRTQWARKFRYNIERCTRNLAKTHVAEFHRVQTADELAQAQDDFVRLHQMRWVAKGEQGSFTFPKFEAFLRTAMNEAFASGRLLFWTYSLDGQCVATLLAFFHNGTAHYFQGGFDTNYAKHSLGSVMVAQCLQDCVDDPAILEFDFMGGGSTYKDSWTSHTRAALELTTFRAGWRTVLFQTGTRTRRQLGRVRRAIRQRLQASRLQPTATTEPSAAANSAVTTPVATQVVSNNDDRT